MERGVTIWGHADKTERNVAAVTAALRGKTLAAAGAEVGLTAERVRQLVAKYCRIAWRRDETLQRDFRSMAELSLEQKRLLADRILAHLPPPNVGVQPPAGGGSAGTNS